MKHSKLLTLALVCAFCAPAYAQESLLDIYQRALQNDPAIREAEMSYRAAAEIKPQTRSGLLPSLNLSSSVAILIRCASPPDSSVAGCPNLR